MVDILLLQTVSIAIASAGVFLAAVYYIVQIRNQTRIRKTDLVIRLYSTLHSNEFDDAYPKVMNLEFRDYEDFVKRYGRRHSGKSPEIDKALSTVNGFFELVGTLLYRKHIDINSVYDSLGGSMIKEVWEKSKPLVAGMRGEFNEPFFNAGFEYLYNEIMRKEPQLRKTWAKASFRPVSDSKLPNKPLGDRNG